MNDLYKFKEKIKKMYVAGIKGLTYVLPFKGKEEFLIRTAGTNLNTLRDVFFSKVLNPVAIKAKIKR